MIRRGGVVVSRPAQNKRSLTYLVKGLLVVGVYGGARGHVSPLTLTVTVTLARWTPAGMDPPATSARYVAAAASGQGQARASLRAAQPDQTPHNNFPEPDPRAPACSHSQIRLLAATPWLSSTWSNSSTVS
eukprot:137417-Chlamydomonas_euryale.AAC.1